MSFENLGLSQPVLQALALKEYTPVDADPGAGHSDRCSRAATCSASPRPAPARPRPSCCRRSTGWSQSDKRPQRGTCRMLVLAPTRELAAQIAESARAYGRFSHMSVATVFGGTSVNKNRQDLGARRRHPRRDAGPPARPDRPAHRSTFASVEILVLDEADQMLDLGFIHALKQIVRMLPIKRQSLFFSATMPKAIKRSRRQVPDRSGAGLGRARGDDGRAGRPICHLRPAGREAGVADHDASRRLRRSRQYGPGADLHPHQAWRRPGRETARRQRHRGQRHPRQQEPAAARAGAGRVQGRQGQDPGRDRHRRARHRRLRRRRT